MDLLARSAGLVDWEATLELVKPMVRERVVGMALGQIRSFIYIHVISPERARDPDSITFIIIRLWQVTISADTVSAGCRRFVH